MSPQGTYRFVQYFHTEGRYGRVHALGTFPHDRGPLLEALSGTNTDVLSHGLSFIPNLSPVIDHDLQVYGSKIGTERTLENVATLLQWKLDAPRAPIVAHLTRTAQLHHHSKAWRPKPFNSVTYTYNLSRDESKALYRLTRLKEVLVLPADKNLGTCVVGANWYDEQVRSHLDDPMTYAACSLNDVTDAIQAFNDQMETLDSTLRIDHHLRSKAILRLPRPRLKRSLVKTGCLPGNGPPTNRDHRPSTRDSRTNRTPMFYLIPKLHKTPPKSRPIVAAKNTYLTPLAKYLQRVFAHIARTVDTHGFICTSTTDAIRRTSAISALPTSSDDHDRATDNNAEEEQLFTADFTSLYTSLRHETVVTATSHLLDRLNDNWSALQKAHVIKYLTVLLNSCFFSEPRSGSFRKQLSGVPMGGPASGDIANCVLLHYELLQSELVSANIRAFPRFYLRFIDDCLGLASETTRQQLLDCFPNDLPLNVEHEGDTVPFLDINISISPRPSDPYLRTDIYEKGLSAYEYVLPTSGHRRNQPHGIIVGALTRLAGICDSYSRFDAQCKTLWLRLKNRGYRWTTWCSARRSFIYQDARRKALELPLLFPPVHMGPTEAVDHIIATLRDPCHSCTVTADGSHRPTYETASSQEDHSSTRVIVHQLHNQFAPDPQNVATVLHDTLRTEFDLEASDYTTLTCWHNQRPIRTLLNRKALRLRKEAH